MHISHQRTMQPFLRKYLVFLVKIYERLAFDPHLRKVFMILFRGETIETHFKFRCNFAHLFDPKWSQQILTHMKNCNCIFCHVLHKPFTISIYFALYLMLIFKPNSITWRSIFSHMALKIHTWIVTEIVLHCTLINICTLYWYTQGRRI